MRRASRQSGVRGWGRASERADGRTARVCSLARSLGGERASERTDGRPREGKGFLNKGPLVRGRPRSVGSLAPWGASERVSERTDERADGQNFSGGGGASERASERADGRTARERTDGAWLRFPRVMGAFIRAHIRACIGLPGFLVCSWLWGALAPCCSHDCDFPVRGFSIFFYFFCLFFLSRDCFLPT